LTQVSRGNLWKTEKSGKSENGEKGVWVSSWATRRVSGGEEKPMGQRKVRKTQIVNPQTGGEGEGPLRGEKVHRKLKGFKSVRRAHPGMGRKNGRKEATGGKIKHTKGPGVWPTPRNRPREHLRGRTDTRGEQILTETNKKKGKRSVEGAGQLDWLGNWAKAGKKHMGGSEGTIRARWATVSAQWTQNFPPKRQTRKDWHSSGSKKRTG